MAKKIELLFAPDNCSHSYGNSLPLIFIETMHLVSPHPSVILVRKCNFYSSQLSCKGRHGESLKCKMCYRKAGNSFVICTLEIEVYSENRIHMVLRLFDYETIANMTNIMFARCVTMPFCWKNAFINPSTFILFYVMKVVILCLRHANNQTENSSQSDLLAIY